MFFRSLKPAASISLIACFSLILCIDFIGTNGSSALYSIKNNCPLDFNAFFIDEIISKNLDQVEQFKNGNTKLLGFFVGQVMKATQGKANPKQVNQILNDRLS